MIGYGARQRERGCRVRSLVFFLKYVCPKKLFIVYVAYLINYFSQQVLVGTIRSEIASCSEKAYPSLPILNAKNLLFLESEGAVVTFAQERGWVAKDGRIYFPLQQGQDVRTEKEILVASGQVIENTIGYARELETIV